jgi:hypothetical protein
MKEYCQNPLCENKAVKQVPVSVREASDQKRSLCAACEEVYTWGVQQGTMSQKGLLIEPPPKETGPEPLYRVVYAIDVNSPNPQQAAEQAYEIMTDRESIRPVLHIVDGRGRNKVVDLAISDARVGASLDESQEKARRFVEAAGAKCPTCDSEDIDFGTVELDAQCAYQEACCRHCQKRFCAVYRLVGYGLHVGDSLEVHTITQEIGKIKGATG